MRGESTRKLVKMGERYELAPPIQTKECISHSRWPDHGPRTGSNFLHAPNVKFDGCDPQVIFGFIVIVVIVVEICFAGLCYANRND